MELDALDRLARPHLESDAWKFILTSLSAMIVLPELNVGRALTGRGWRTR